MKKQTRERFALIVFLVLIVFAIILLIGYFTTGRSWNVAASVVDEITGEMESYTAIVYEGTIDSASFDEDNLDDEADGSRFDKSDDSSPGEYDLSLHDANSGLKSLLPDIFSGLQKGTENADAKVYVSDVRDFYERKGSNAITLNLDDLSSYYEPQILFSGDKRIGIVAIDYYATNSRISHMTNYFKDNEADTVICLTPRTNLLATYSGIDIILVTTNFENIPTTGKIMKSTFVLRSPAVGQVGALILTANDIPSAKVFTEL